MSRAGPLDCVYSRRYQASGLRHFERLACTHAALAETDGIRFHTPAPVDPALLRALHDPVYVEAVLQGTPPLAAASYLPWSPGLVEACLAMLGGQLLAAELALAHGLAVNLACGFHHAHPARGGGFCVFNGLALVALAHPTRQVMVLDCDEHGGDGTEAFCERLPNLSAISVYGTRFGLRGGPRSVALAVPEDPDIPRDRLYLETLDQAIDHLLTARPHLLIYQASADSHIDDPKATLRLCSETLQQRDLHVLRAMHWARIPVLLTLAGGYQAPDTVAQLYRRTIEVAVHLRRDPPPQEPAA